MSKNTNVVTVANVNAALDKAHARWFANRKPAVVAKGIDKSDDIATARKLFTAQTCEFITNNLNDNLKAKDVLDFISNDAGVKACKRLPEFVNALHAGNYKMLDGVTALEVLSAAYAGAVTRKAVFFAATGKGDESTSDVVKDISLVRKLQKYIAGVGVTTENTQNSRSFGKNGFCGALGMGAMVKNEHGQRVLSVDQTNPFFIMLSKMIENASDSSLELIKGAKAE